jgi:hypothetical protein
MQEEAEISKNEQAHEELKKEVEDFQDKLLDRKNFRNFKYP